MKTLEKNYQAEAADLLKKLGVKFSTKFINYAPHFAGEKESRDNFRATFIRENFSIHSGKFARFSINFGQSINSSDGGGGNPPTAYDVITCLTKYDVGSFENFCGDFGYDTDSRQAERTYKAAVKEWEKVSRFFTSEELELLNEIQ